MKGEGWFLDRRVQAFAMEFLPTQVAGGRAYTPLSILSDNGQLVPGTKIRQGDAACYLQLVGSDFLRQYGLENYGEFRDRMLRVMGKAQAIERRVDPRGEGNGFEFLRQFFARLRGMNLEQKLDACSLNSRLAKKWGRGHWEKMGEFFARPCAFPRPGVPMAVEIRRMRDGGKAAELDFFVYHDRGRVRARISALLEHAGSKEMALLERGLGGNWAQKIAKRFADKALGRGILVEAEIPQAFRPKGPLFDELRTEREWKMHSDAYKSIGMRANKKGLWRLSRARRFAKRTR